MLCVNFNPTLPLQQQQLTLLLLYRARGHVDRGLSVVSSIQLSKTRGMESSGVFLLERWRGRYSEILPPGCREQPLPGKTC